MSALPPADAVKFGKIIGLLSSDYDGERAAAALKATEFLRAHHLGWGNVAHAMVALPVPGPQPPRTTASDQAYQAGFRPEPVYSSADYQRTARLLLVSGHPWNAWERKFLRSISNCRKSLSALQRQKLADCMAEARSRDGGV